MIEQSTAASTAKILVAYHKPSRLFANSILTPIHVGRAVCSSWQDHKDFFQSIIGDDTGDNISHLNPYYSEMTAVYWAWKNYERIGSPDYFGLAHYRRFLGFGHSSKQGYIVIPDMNQVPSQLYAEEIISPVITNHDICVRTPIKITQSFFDEDKNEVITQPVDPIVQYACAHDIQHLELALNLVAHKFPDYRNTISTFITTKNHYLCNLFVMKREIFFEYAAWIFSILNIVHNSIDYSKLDLYQQRVIGFLAERLTGLFILRKMELGLNINHIIGVEIGTT